MLLKCNFDENEDNHRWHNIKPVDAVRVVIMTMVIMMLLLVLLVIIMSMIIMQIVMLM